MILFKTNMTPLIFIKLGVGVSLQCLIRLSLAIYNNADISSLYQISIIIGQARDSL